ncbi:MAG: hypothetical protein LBE81_08555 [Azonexus sp.]|jgi:hypothetical protein|uniref:hypothetical protein n=1 Tax=Azonexus sp. TaxID=1872668 RepID=UPI0028309B83|nr:hypothetical protein [Azonexus sp.]MDR0776673.1 hypothetical protein [Azonexus sp.]
MQLHENKPLLHVYFPVRLKGRTRNIFPNPKFWVRWDFDADIFQRIEQAFQENLSIRKKPPFYFCILETVKTGPNDISNSREGFILEDQPSLYIWANSNVFIRPQFQFYRYLGYRQPYMPLKLISKAFSWMQTQPELGVKKWPYALQIGSFLFIGSKPEFLLKRVATERPVVASMLKSINLAPNIALNPDAFGAGWLGR